LITCDFCGIEISRNRSKPKGGKIIILCNVNGCSWKNTFDGCSKCLQIIDKLIASKVSKEEASEDQHD